MLRIIKPVTGKKREALPLRIEMSPGSLPRKGDSCAEDEEQAQERNCSPYDKRRFADPHQPYQHKGLPNRLYSYLDLLSIIQALRGRA